MQKPEGNKYVLIFGQSVNTICAGKIIRIKKDKTCFNVTSTVNMLSKFKFLWEYFVTYI